MQFPGSCVRRLISPTTVQECGIEVLSTRDQDRMDRMRNWNMWDIIKSQQFNPFVFIRFGMMPVPFSELI